METMPLIAPSGSIQLTDYREFLHRILENVPPRDRVDFICEVMQSLDEEDRRAVIEAPDNAWRQSMLSLAAILGTPQSQPGKTSSPEAQKLSSGFEMLRRNATGTATPVGASEGSTLNASSAKPATADGSVAKGPTATDQVRARLMNAAAYQGINEAPVDMPKPSPAKAASVDSARIPAADRQWDQREEVETKFKQIAATEGNSDVKTTMRRELVGCLGLGLLGLAVLIGLSFGAGKLWNFLLTYL